MIQLVSMTGWIEKFGRHFTIFQIYSCFSFLVDNLIWQVATTQLQQNSDSNRLTRAHSLQNLFSLFFLSFYIDLNTFTQNASISNQYMQSQSQSSYICVCVCSMYVYVNVVFMFVSICVSMRVFVTWLFFILFYFIFFI